MPEECASWVSLAEVERTAQVNPRLAVVQAFGVIEQAGEQAARLLARSSAASAPAANGGPASDTVVQALVRRRTLASEAEGVLRRLQRVRTAAVNPATAVKPETARRYARLAFFMADKIREAARAAAEQSA